MDYKPSHSIHHTFTIWRNLRKEKSVMVHLFLGIVTLILKGLLSSLPPVRLGKSGLKISKIILGTMQYGHKEWEEWVLGEEEAIQHIKVA